MSDPARKMTLLQATMLVAGNMIGTGVFLLPVSLASVGSIAIFGWLVATAGAAALGLVFAKLGELDPQEGGPYAYARDFLGPYVGFQTNYIYWFGNWIGNIAIAVAAVGYLAELVPFVTHPPASVYATAVVIWVLTFANILGPRVVGALETWTLSLALVPILAIAFFGWFWFDQATFLAGWNASGTSSSQAISRAASMALWAFMGLESAAVSAGVIENPKRNIPLATLLGLGLSAVVYVLSSSVIMGIIPNAELQKSHAPFAEAARLALGTWGMVVISLCAILKSLGSLGGWMLLVGQSAKAAADDGMFPRGFARLNRHGVPGRGLVIVGVLMTIVLFATMSPTIAGQFNRIIDLTVILVVIPYIYASVAVVKVIFDRGLPRRTFQTFKWIAMAAVAYCLWAVMGGHPQTVVHALVVLLLSVPLYPFFIRSMEAAAKRKEVLNDEIERGGLKMRGFVMLAALGLSGPAVFAQEVKVDFDRGADFSKYKTVAVKIGTSWNNPLSEKRVLSEIEQTLAEKGWQTSTPDQADTVAVLHGATEKQRSLNTFYSGGYGGYGWYGWGGGMGSSTTTETEYLVGTLVVDIFDARTKQLLFRGIAQDEISDKPEKNMKKIAKASDKLFKNFPPGSKD